MGVYTIFEIMNMCAILSPLLSDLLRALSVARIVITGSTNLTDDTLPIDLTASDSPTFNLKICASFSGRGLTGPLGK